MQRNKYFAIFRFAFVHSLKNTKALIGLSIFLITCLLIFAHLWKIAAAKMGTLNLDPTHLLWYIALNEWVLISLPDTQEDIEEDLRSGRLAYLLPRPISYLVSLFAEGLGTLSARLLFLGCATFLFTSLRAGSFPFGWSALLTTIALGFLAGTVGVLFKMAIGLSAFWINQVEPFHWIWEKLLFTLGGLMLPLAVYPEWMQQAARYTPFPAILGDRSALIIESSWQSALSLASLLLFWGALGLFLTLFLYQRGLRIINIEGG